MNVLESSARTLLQIYLLLLAELASGWMQVSIYCMADWIYSIIATYYFLMLLYSWLRSLLHLYAMPSKQLISKQVRFNLLQ